MVGTDVVLANDTARHACASATLDPEGGKIALTYSAIIVSEKDFSCRFYVYQGATLLAERQCWLRADNGSTITSRLPVLIQYSTRDYVGPKTFTIRVSYDGAHNPPQIIQGYLQLQGLKR